MKPFTDPELERQRQRYQELHGALDELLAAWIAANPEKHLSDTSIMDLLQWSHLQTIRPGARVLADSGVRIS